MKYDIRQALAEVIAMATSNQRVLAVGLLVVAVIGVLGITVAPVYVANASRQGQLDDMGERLARYEQVIERDQSLLPQYEAAIRRQRSAGNHLRSGTSALAGAELQRLVESISAANKAQIVSRQILPIAEEEGFQRIAIRVRLRGPLPAILGSFYAIETHDVFLFLDNIVLRDNMAGRVPARGQQQVQLRSMDAEFDLIGYMPEES